MKFRPRIDLKLGGKISHEMTNYLITHCADLNYTSRASLNLIKLRFGAFSKLTSLSLWLQQILASNDTMYELGVLERKRV